MSTLQEFKCPCCNGAISFDTKLQKMKCPYCDTEFTLETLQQYDSVKIEEEDQFEWVLKCLIQMAQIILLYSADIRDSKGYDFSSLFLCVCILSGSIHFFFVIVPELSGLKYTLIIIVPA